MSVSFLLNVHAPSSWQLQSIAIQGEVEGGHTTSGGVADPHRLPLILARTLGYPVKKMREHEQLGTQLCTQNQTNEQTWTDMEIYVISASSTCRIIAAHCRAGDFPESA